MKIESMQGSKLRRLRIGLVTAVLMLMSGLLNSETLPWKYATWGKGYAFVYYSANGKMMATGQIDDIDSADGGRDDGYCVYIRVRMANQDWPAMSFRKPWPDGAKSCGPLTYYWFPVQYSSPPAGVRLYRDDGRYMTLWGS